ncbi:hypothetical protein AAMO2058_001292500 [Amorphochlora amoebiformis]
MDVRSPFVFHERKKGGLTNRGVLKRAKGHRNKTLNDVLKDRNPNLRENENAFSGKHGQKTRTRRPLGDITNSSRKRTNGLSKRPTRPSAIKPKAQVPKPATVDSKVKLDLSDSLLDDIDDIELCPKPSKPVEYESGINVSAIKKGLKQMTADFIDEVDEPDMPLELWGDEDLDGISKDTKFTVNESKLDLSEFSLFDD